MRVHLQRQVALFLLGAVAPNMSTLMSSGMGVKQLVRGQLGEQTMLC